MESVILLRSNRSELFAPEQQKRERDEIERLSFISPSVHFSVNDDFQRHVKNRDERFQETTRTFLHRFVFEIDDRRFFFQEQKMFSVVDELVRTRRELNEVKEQLRLVNLSMLIFFVWATRCAFS